MNEQADLIPMKLGEKLRAARLARGLQKDFIADTLKIGIHTLESMESDNWEALAPVYRNAFASKYAAYLELDAGDVAGALNALPEPDQELRAIFKERPRQALMERNLRIASYLAVTVFIVTPIIWIFTQQVVNWSQGRATVAQPMGLSQSTDRQPERSNSHVQANVAPLGMLRSAETAPGAKAGDGRSEPGAPGMDSGSAADGSQLRLVLNADSWVHITDGEGRRLEYDLLRGGSSKHYRGRAPFNILIGRASAVELYLDSKRVDLAPYLTGNVANLELHDDAADRG